MVGLTSKWAPENVALAQKQEPSAAKPAGLLASKWATALEPKPTPLPTPPSSAGSELQKQRRLRGGRRDKSDRLDEPEKRDSPKEEHKEASKSRTRSRRLRKQEHEGSGSDDDKEPMSQAAMDFARRLGLGSDEKSDLRSSREPKRAPRHDSHSERTHKDNAAKASHHGDSHRTTKEHGDNSHRSLRDHGDNRRREDHRELDHRFAKDRRDHRDTSHKESTHRETHHKETTHRDNSRKDNSRDTHRGSQPNHRRSSDQKEPMSAAGRAFALRIGKPDPNDDDGFVTTDSEPEEPKKGVQPGKYLTPKQKRARLVQQKEQERAAEQAEREAKLKLEVQLMFEKMSDKSQSWADLEDE